MFALLAMMMPYRAGAYDFKKSLKGGVTLYFMVVKNAVDEVSVVAPKGREGYGNLPQPKGRVAIPDEVLYDGVRYRVTSIGQYAFAGCGITAVTVPENVTKIAIGAFDNCTQLRSLTLRCDSLSQAVKSFERCSALDTIVIDESVRILPPFLFAELNTLKHIRLLANGERLKNLFFGSQSQATVSIGERVSMIPPFVFYNFTGLKHIDYEGVDQCLSTIGQCAFSGCTGLRNVVVPQNTSRIEPYAFAYCVPQSITFLSKRPPSISELAFYSVDSQTPVYIPCSTRGVYANSGVGRLFGNLVYMDECQGKGEAEVVYIHDTVFIHDTVYLPYTEFIESHFSRPADTAVADEPDDMTEEEEIEEDDGLQWLFIDGKVLRISRATQMRGVSVRVFDEKGRIVTDELIPPDQPADNYYIKLPKRQRYFLRFDMGTPIMVDVQSQEIKL